ncbi:UPF0098 protein [Longispora fulva]|uniref:Raf kinase inhibitor-like YbhB/YbcL family protein n=1 Tax=Longispora fulva TaxID=619741 RepID=A0A8J7GI21_9ACTN|nr:YbhB/YbcL family Raf kinase inhibitor-like protein [Longispora fulva]MBG6139584.1 Raf kinase inhibitor-like YbhB/YbcL family protein [Longispora fulva]GIG58033.1 UPF0098 protein [Longispora fulva]
MRAPIPYEFLPAVPEFTVKSDDLVHGGRVADPQVYNRGNVSPQLSWSGFPAGTRSFAVTCFDPDAPTGSGFWHWLLFDVPADVTSLESGAAGPAGSVTTPSDYGQPGYGGPYPPPGPAHRYVFAVHALDVPTLGLAEDTRPPGVGFTITKHTIARAVLVAEFGF